MWIYLLSQLLHFVSGLCSVILVIPYLQYVFPGVIFVVLGTWAKTIIVGYFLVLAYDITTSLVGTPIWCMYSVLQAPLYFGWHL